MATSGYFFMATDNVHRNRPNVSLTNLSVYRELDGRIHVFVGPRGIDKTSLLRNAQKDVETGTFVTVWATGGDSVSLCVDLANELGKDCLKKSQKHDIWDARLEACSEAARLRSFRRCGLSISRCRKLKI